MELIITIVAIIIVTIFVTALVTSFLIGVFTIPYVPTPSSVVNEILMKMEIKDGDRIAEIGCGDGRMLFELLRQYPNADIQCIGYEISPLLYLYCELMKTLTLNKSQRTKIRFVLGNVFNTASSLSDFNKIYVYLFPQYTSRTLALLKNNKHNWTLYSYVFGSEIALHTSELLTNKKHLHIFTQV